MKIAVFGSCVSRDTAEFIPEAEVVSYVARHSVTTLLSPHGAEGVDLNKLESPFQQRMVIGDLNGAGIENITKNAHETDLVLLDLVDERRGYWLFPNGVRVTNSVETEISGFAQKCQIAGARLVEFGTNEHYRSWQRGIDFLIEALKYSDLWEKTIFLDLEWASAIQGGRPARYRSVAQFGRTLRHTRRCARNAIRSARQSEGIVQVWKSFNVQERTQSDIFAESAEVANAKYKKYRKYAKSLMAHTIERRSAELRIDPDHKWGPQPYHYRQDDYISISNEIFRHLGGSPECSCWTSR